MMTLQSYISPELKRFWAEHHTQHFRFHDMKELITSMALRLAHTAAKQEHGPEILHESARCPPRPLVSFVPSALGCSSQHAGSSRPFQ
jgi:hypothetical protein